MALIELLEQAKVLDGPAATVPALQDLVDDLLGRLLDTEGPPVDPIQEFSEDYRSGFVRSPKSGRPLAVAHTWTTGPWRCLLLESPSVPMGRPIFLPKGPVGGSGGLSPANFRVILGSRTQGAIRRIVGACQALGITTPTGEAAVHAVFGTHRTFVAWRPRREDEPWNRAVRGDSDNLAKTVLDALQQAGVVVNDRGVFRLSAVKALPESWSAAPKALEDALKEEAKALQAHGKYLETVRVELRLSRAHMARLFPGEYRAPGAALDPATAQARARIAVDAIAAGASYHKARTDAQAPGKPLRPLVAKLFRDRVVKGELALQDLAHQLGLDVRTAAALYKGDAEAKAALHNKPKPTPTKARRKAAAPALQAALNDVHAGTPASQAARKHKVSVASLRSRIARENRQSKGKKKGK